MFREEFDNWIQRKTGIPSTHIATLHKVRSEYGCCMAAQCLLNNQILDL